MIWLIALLVLIVAAVVIVRVVNRVRSLPVFYGTYNRAIDQGASEKEALESVISIFAQRPPFDILDQADITWLAESFSGLPNPKVLGQVFLEMDRDGDASGLKRRENMLDFVEKLQNHQIDSLG